MEMIALICSTEYVTGIIITIIIIIRERREGEEGERRRSRV